MLNCTRCSVKDSITQFKTSKQAEIYSPNMQYTTSLQMNIIACRLWGFEELFLFAGIRSALALKQVCCFLAVCCIVLQVGLRTIFLPKRPLLKKKFNDYCRVFKRVIWWKSSCYKLPIDACVREETRSGERAWERDTDAAEIWKYHRQKNKLHFGAFLGLKNKASLVCTSTIFSFFV